MTYRDQITNCMTMLSMRPETIFIGYNILYGSKVYGTMNHVVPKTCLEMPVAEDLITGVAIGLALQGFKPVLIFERHNFMWLAMDQLLNHLDKIPQMSEDQFMPCVLIRAIVGSSSPLYPGPQHCGDYTEVFKRLFTSIGIIEVKTWSDINKYLEYCDTPRMFIERREWYENEV